MKKSALAKAKSACDRVLASHRRIRHIGYYDSLGKILYDVSRGRLEPLKGEGVEEMHILNGTAATALVIWKRSDRLIGRLGAFIMVLDKVVDLIVPQNDTGSYFLAVFDKETPISEVDRVRLSLAKS